MDEERDRTAGGTSAVGFQGAPGAWSEEAILALFDPPPKPVGFASFADVFDALHEDKVDAAVLPVENSTTGSVFQVVDQLFATEAHVVGEAILAIRHALLAPPGTELEEIECVVSHPQALDQCAAFLREHGIEAVPGYDTAGAAARLGEHPPGTGALASPLAARRHGLSVLVEDVPDQVNRTRFLQLEPEARQPPGADKTSLGFVTPHEPGALVACLHAFSDHDVNLLKLESRPIPDQPWHYRFVADAQGALASEPVQRALEQLEEEAESVKVFGSYPAAEPLDG